MANALLKISNKKVLNNFIHSCIDNLTQQKHISFESYTSDIEWTIDDFNAALAFIRSIFFKHVDFEKIEINPLILQSIRDCYEIRQKEISQARIKNRWLESNKHIVENIDWKLKWIMGSSTLAGFREPLLQVDLYCFKKSGDAVRHNINFEMNLEQVDKLIRDLENIKTQL